jgi:hypothetical protein
METFKFGNKVKCIIRFHDCSKSIGGITPQFDEQPYTVLNNLSVTVNFKSNSKNITSKESAYLMSNQVDEIGEIQLRNCLLTDKLIYLLFGMKESVGNFTAQCQVTADEEGNLYLPTTKTVCRAFVYDNNGDFYAAYSLEGREKNNPVLRGSNLDFTDGQILTKDNCIFSEIAARGFIANQDYMVFYEYPGQFTFSIDSQYSSVMTFDLISDGNLEDSTKSFCLHIAKATVSANKTFYFTKDGSNTIDLTLKVIQPLSYEIEEGKVNYIAVC